MDKPPFTDADAPNAYPAANDFPDMVGKSPAMLELYEKVAKIAPTEVPILIQGETGTGKDALAKAIHQASLRRHGPYVPFNCGELTPELAASSLFGHVKGGFTGAVGNKLGYFREANGGTLFIDEVAELLPHIQAALLRALQERVVRPVGAERNFPADVRVVAATHKNLREEIAAGRFRQDLYERLNGITLWLPPLRERKEDLRALVEHFLAKWHKHPEPVRFTEDAYARLAEHPFPGNVRELDMLIHRTLSLRAQPEVITAADLQFAPAPVPQPLQAANGTPSPAEGVFIPAGTPLDEAVLEIKKAAIERNGGNKTKAAQELHICRAVLCGVDAKPR